MERQLKNFWVYGGASPVNRVTWDCPELVGHYKMKILMMSMGTNPFTAYQFTINSPQIVSKNLNSYPIYNPYNFNIDFINFFNVGFSNGQMNRYICGDLSADVLMNGKLDYQHAVFNSTWVQSGKVLLAFDYVINNNFVITAEFTRVKDEIPKLLLSPDRKRFIKNIYNKDNYWIESANYSSEFDSRLVGRFRCRMIFNVCISGFPENVGCYLISPQFDLNKKYYFSIGEVQRNDVYGDAPYDYIATCNGFFRFTTYSNRNQAIEPIQNAVFTWEFIEV